MNIRLVLIAHNIRSSHNVGSLLRTAEGLGVDCVYMTGYTPHPATKGDQRLPHIAQKTAQAIAKTALGAEKTQKWQYISDIQKLFAHLSKKGYKLAALEQSPKSKTLASYNAPSKLALVVGREVEGLEPDVLESVEVILEIPMRGMKESFNVCQAAAMALYQFRYHQKNL